MDLTYTEYVDNEKERERFIIEACNTVIRLAARGILRREAITDDLDVIITPSRKHTSGYAFAVKDGEIMWHKLLFGNEHAGVVFLNGVRRGSYPLEDMAFPNIPPGAESLIHLMLHEVAHVLDARDRPTELYEDESTNHDETWVAKLVYLREKYPVEKCIQIAAENSEENMTEFDLETHGKIGMVHSRNVVVSAIKSCGEDWHRTVEQNGKKIGQITRGKVRAKTWELFDEESGKKLRDFPGQEFPEVFTEILRIFS